jgi:hypothetical protein
LTIDRLRSTLQDSVIGPSRGAANRAGNRSSGGTGKTRLADQVARRAAGRFADGAWLAELAPVQDPADVGAVVAAALGVRDQPGVPVAEVPARVLARQQLLLVLDNCEHVIGAAAQLCAGLLAARDTTPGTVKITYTTGTINKKIRNASAPARMPPPTRTVAGATSVSAGAALAGSPAGDCGTSGPARW